MRDKIQIAALLAIGLAITVLFGACEGDPVNRLPRSAFAPEPNYPRELEYQPKGNRYLGAPGIEMRAERNSVAMEPVEVPIATFGAAFDYAYRLAVREYGADRINSQLPLLMDYQGGIWVVQGALQHSKDPDVIIMGGEVHLAFRADSGDVVYLLHTL